MFKLAFAFVLLCAGVYARPNPEINPFIIGGNNATEGQFPYAVSLRLSDGFMICGGALISERHVLTAAHCVLGNRKLKIGVGSINLNIQRYYDVHRAIIHPNYSTINLGNDIAVLRLRHPVKLSSTVKTINFPVTEDLVGKKVTAIGWGFIDNLGPISETLLYIRRRILSNKACQKRHQNEIFPSQICIGFEYQFGMCFGDSGSPMVYQGPDGKDYVAGIVSWGIACAKGFPDVFTRVSSYDKWIRENMI